MARARTPRPKAVAPPIQKCNVWDGRSDLTGRLAAEKYDGHRVYWTGTQLLTRRGRVLDNAPAWFTAGLPTDPLDCELWAGKGRLASVTKATQSTRDPDPHWRHLRLLVFDAPSVPGPLSRRVRALYEIVGDNRYAVPVPHWRVTDHAQLRRDLDGILEVGGEGIVVRTDTPYAPGYSDEWLKVKPFIDGEAFVHEHMTDGHGIVNGLRMQMPVSGETFDVTQGVSPIMTPPVGSILTYRTEALSRDRGVPCLGTRLICIRTDVSPDDLSEPRVGTPFLP